jgi:hypothetical protein
MSAARLSLAIAGPRAGCARDRRSAEADHRYRHCRGLPPRASASSCPADGPHGTRGNDLAGRVTDPSATARGLARCAVGLSVVVPPVWVFCERVPPGPVGPVGPVGPLRLLRRAALTPRSSGPEGLSVSAIPGALEARRCPSRAMPAAPIPASARTASRRPDEGSGSGPRGPASSSWNEVTAQPFLTRTQPGHWLERHRSIHLHSPGAPFRRGCRLD